MRTKKSCGPDTPTLVSSSRAYEARGRQGQESPVPGESTKETVAPSRREGRMLGQTCGDCRQLFLLLAGHGCGQRPAFPAPLIFSRADVLQSSGEFRRENATAWLERVRII